MAKRKIVRGVDDVVIGEVQEEFPYKVQWNRKATASEKEQFALWLSDPHTTRTAGKGDDPGTCITEIVTHEPEDERFLDVLSGDLHFHGYWIMRPGKANLF